MRRRATFGAGLRRRRRSCGACCPPALTWCVLRVVFPALYTRLCTITCSVLTAASAVSVFRHSLLCLRLQEPLPVFSCTAITILRCRCHLHSPEARMPSVSWAHTRSHDPLGAAAAAAGASGGGRCGGRQPLPPPYWQRHKDETLRAEKGQTCPPSACACWRANGPSRAGSSLSSLPCTGNPCRLG